MKSSAANIIIYQLIKKHTEEILLRFQHSRSFTYVVPIRSRSQEIQTHVSDIVFWSVKFTALRTAKVVVTHHCNPSLLYSETTYAYVHGESRQTSGNMMYNCPSNLICARNNSDVKNLSDQSNPLKFFTMHFM